MARRVFFSFHFGADVFRANQVRNHNVVHGPDVAGYYDHSEYLKAKAQGDAGIERMIRRHLEGTSVTVVLIGQYTAERRWVQFEIDESVKRNNGLLGIDIHNVLAPPWFGAPRDTWTTSPAGPRPFVAFPAEMPVYIWSPKAVAHFRQLIEEAGLRGERAKRDAEFFRTMARRRLNALPDIDEPPMVRLGRLLAGPRVSPGPVGPVLPNIVPPPGYVAPVTRPSWMPRPPGSVLPPIPEPPPSVGPVSPLRGALIRHRLKLK